MSGSEVERPLHVQVAEALGWTELAPQEWIFGETTYIRDDVTGWLGRSPDKNILRRCPPPRYDTDWSATGPLIEKYGIGLKPGVDWWWAYADGDGFAVEDGNGTALLAVCHLILAIGRFGKL